jgi:hypothetical protein
MFALFELDLRGITAIYALLPDWHMSRHMLIDFLGSNPEAWVSLGSGLGSAYLCADSRRFYA